MDKKLYCCVCGRKEKLVFYEVARIRTKGYSVSFKNVSVCKNCEPRVIKECSPYSNFCIKKTVKNDNRVVSGYQIILNKI